MTYFSHNCFLSNYIQKRIRFLGRNKRSLLTGAISNFLLTRAITSFESFPHVERKLQVKSYREATEVGNRQDFSTLNQIFVCGEKTRPTLKIVIDVKEPFVVENLTGQN
ncbi:hypothetical protein TNCV_2697961 [Trichonephila clavipes]|nr:hypothetical protein TNCV_2697961 [Trichonephila clavipes]